jgi:hypothetical protein
MNVPAISHGTGDTARIFNFEGLELHGTWDAKHGWLFSTAEIARGYGVSEGAIRQHKRHHADELVEGHHWISVRTANSNPRGGIAPIKSLWTIQGGNRLGFFFNSQTAKRFRRCLESLMVGGQPQLPAPEASQDTQTVPAAKYIQLQDDHIALQDAFIAELRRGRRPFRPHGARAARRLSVRPPYAKRAANLRAIIVNLADEASMAVRDWAEQHKISEEVLVGLMDESGSHPPVPEAGLQALEEIFFGVPGSDLLVTVKALQDALTGQAGAAEMSLTAYGESLGIHKRDISNLMNYGFHLASGRTPELSRTKIQHLAALLLPTSQTN